MSYCIYIIGGRVYGSRASVALCVCMYVCMCVCVCVCVEGRVTNQKIYKKM